MTQPEPYAFPDTIPMSAEGVAALLIHHTRQLAARMRAVDSITLGPAALFLIEHAHMLATANPDALHAYLMDTVEGTTKNLPDPTLPHPEGH